MLAMSEIFEEEGYVAPDSEPKGIFYRPYRPKLNPLQSHAFDRIQKHLYTLLFGERYSGKSVVGTHALVHHCRENYNARALMIVPTGRQGEEGGAWHKLNTFIRAEWEQGGGAVFTEPRQNKYKDTYIWISNKFGGWSRVVLVSMPYEGFVAPRVKGIEPTFVLVDEAQTLETDTYFKHLVQQLGRDTHIAHQPIVYTANPAGPSHWLYIRFFIQPVNADGSWNDNYFVLHLPINDNKKNLPPKYWERLLDATKGDDTEYRRNVLGEWVEASTEDALFHEDYNETVHVRGNALKNEGILPIVGQPIVLGWDLGQAHSAIIFEQFIPTVSAIKWIMFDECVYIDRYMPYSRLVPIVIKRMKYWNERQKTEFRFQHISDDSAFNQFRAAKGSFDCKDVEDIAKKHGMTIKMVAAPKGPFSIETRVRLTKEKLQEADVLVSATCTRCRESFMKLECAPNNAMIPKPKSRFGHAFSAWSYPFLYYSARGEGSMRPQVGEVVTPQVYAA
jgi:phage terminase large subunit